MLRDAAWGRASWEDACRRLARILPGSAPTIVNYDLPRTAINAAFVRGIDPAYLQSYSDHYVALNPWMDFWTSTPSGVVSISERDSPAIAFSHTEFYNDWLLPQGNMGAAVGVRLDVGPHDTIHIAWHYDVAMAAAYDAPAAAILERLKSDVVDAVRASALLRDGIDDGLRLGGLIERIDGAAMLVERDRRIREANTQATAAIRKGRVLTGAGDVLALREPGAQRWLEETVARLADGLPVATADMTFCHDDCVFGVSLTPAPELAEGDTALLIRPRPRVLVVIRFLAGGTISIDRAGLRVAYGLSPSEIRLCEALLNGRSLSESALLLGVSEGTVRQRAKVIFNKTRTHRQGELVALLARFGTGDW